MKIGFADVLLILVIGVVFILLSPGKTSRKAIQPAIRIRRPTAAELEKERIKKSRRLRLRVLAGFLLIVGMAMLLNTLGILKFITLSYVWAGILLIVGIFVLFWSTRR